MKKKQKGVFSAAVKEGAKIAIYRATKSLRTALLRLALQALPHVIIIGLVILAFSLIVSLIFTPIANSNGLFNFTGDPATEYDTVTNQKLMDRYKKVSDSTVDAQKAGQHPEMNSFKVDWGLLAAIDKELNNCEKPEPESYASVLKPNFTFKTLPKTTIVSESPGTTTKNVVDVELVDQVDTWQGRYAFNYEMVTTSTVSYRTETQVDSAMNSSQNTITVTTTVIEPKLLSVNEPIPRDYSRLINFLKSKQVDQESEIQLVLMMAKNYQTGGGVDVSDPRELISLTSSYGEMGVGYGSPPPSDWIPYFKAAAEQYHGSTDVGQFEALLMAICFTESSFSDARTVISPVGALGPMQFMPGTWDDIGVKRLGYTADDIWNPQKAIMGAALYLADNGADNGDISGIRQALFIYNHSDEYVANVSSLMYFYGTYTGWTTTNTQGYVWPVPGQYRITDHFGPRIHPVSGQAGFHTGMDIGASYGDPIVATKAGTVVAIENTTAYGVSIVIDHGDGTTSFYGHMYEVYSGITVGTQVTAGQPIAPIGSNGYSTGPHLHFEIRQNGQPINPEIIVKPD